MLTPGSAPAAGALGRRRDEDAIKPLISALADRSIEVRERAVVSLGMVPTNRPWPRWFHCSDADPELRERTAITLGRIGDRRAAQPLVDALRDEDALVRERAASALAQLAIPPIEPLIAMLLIAIPRFARNRTRALGRLQRRR